LDTLDPHSRTSGNGKDIKTRATAAKTTAFLKAKPGKAAELESLLRNLASQSRSEPGNLRWDLWQGLDDTSTFVVDELYRDLASVQAHHATPHFQNYASKINDLATRTAVTSRPLDIA
jgi:quinol monooxygenase YgiN